MKTKKYRKRENQFVVAVQLELETDGFRYNKWGAVQQCHRGDWLVNNGGDVYTINEDSFASTYREVKPGQYVKTTPVWAYVAVDAGKVQTKEGTTEYKRGDYWVANNPDGSDAYAVSKDKFEEMYEELNDSTS